MIAMWAANPQGSSWTRADPPTRRWVNQLPAKAATRPTHNPGTRMDSQVWKATTAAVARAE